MRDVFLIRINKKNMATFIAYLVYVIMIHYLFIGPFKNVFAQSYNGILYQYNFSQSKYIFCLIFTLLISVKIKAKLDSNQLTDTILVIVDLLYFIPGLVYQSVTDMPWGYMIVYIIFWSMLQLWSIILKPRKNALFAMIKPIDSNKYIFIMFGLCVGIAVFMMLYTNSIPTISNIASTWADVYGVRAAAKERGMHWILVNIEYWAVYFMMLLITYFMERKKWIYVVILLIAELALFMVQANRVFLFLTICAVVIGCIKISHRDIIIALSIVSILMFIEVGFEGGGVIGTVTDIFRRFSIVPNFDSSLYYDFFLTHEPDFLRSQYSRITQLFGISSPYSKIRIYTQIGQYYYGRTMNANTGLVGGSIGAFGMTLSPIISTFGYIAAFRIFEGASFHFCDRRIITLALILATLSINTNVLLANIFSLTYFMLLVLSMIPCSNDKRIVDSH